MYSIAWKLTEFATFMILSKDDLFWRGEKRATVPFRSLGRVCSAAAVRAFAKFAAPVATSAIERLSVLCWPAITRPPAAFNRATNSPPPLPTSKLSPWPMSFTAALVALSDGGLPPIAVIRSQYVWRTGPRVAVSMPLDRPKVIKFIARA